MERQTGSLRTAAAFRRYDVRMQSDSLRQRWELFERAWGDRARAADVAWSRGLSADERLVIVDDFFDTIRAARSGADEWAAIDARAWEETRAERDRLVAAFRRFGEGKSGTGTAHLAH